MTISVSNLAVSKTAAAGTVIGGLTLLDSTGTARVANFISDEDAAGYFGISGNNLVTMRASIPAGYYSVQIYANAEYMALSGEANFLITVS